MKTIEDQIIDAVEKCFAAGASLLNLPYDQIVKVIQEDHVDSKFKTYFQGFKISLLIKKSWLIIIISENQVQLAWDWLQNLKKKPVANRNMRETLPPEHEY